MGLSLRNITKKIQGVEAQLNPFDRGATYSHPAAQPSVAQNTAVNRSFIDKAIHYGAPSLGQATRDVVIRPLVARPLTELATTLAGQQKTYTPGNRVEKFFLGDKPLQNIEKKVASQYTRQSQSTIPILRAAAGPLAAGTAAASLVTDIPVGFGAVKGAKPIVKAASPFAKIAVKKLGPEIDPALLAERNRHVVGAANAKGKPDIIKYHEQKIARIDRRITEHQQGGYVRIGKGNESPLPSPPMSPKTQLTPDVKLKTPTGQGSVQKANIPRSFNETVRNSPITSSKLSAELKTSAGYIPKSNKVLLGQARSIIGQNYDAAHQIATTEASDRGVAIASELIKLHQSRGEFGAAVDVANKSAKNLTDLGRGVQAASLYSRISPAGIVRYAARQAQKGGKEIEASTAKQLNRMAEDVAKMPDGEGKAIAVQKMLELAKSQNPSLMSEKLVTLWKAGLLTGPKTHAGNILSNTIESATRNLLLNPVAKGFDLPTSLITGKSSRSLTTRGLASGVKEGLGRGKTYLKTGYDRRNPLSKYDIQKNVSFGKGKLGKAAEAYSQGVFRLLGSADQPFYYANFRNSLADRAITVAKSQGLKGAQRKAFIENFTKEPPVEHLQGAVEDAWRSVWGNETILGNIAAKAKQPFTMKVAGKEVKYSGAAGNFVIPFSRVPASIATRIVERSPLGYVKAANQIVKAARGKGFDQRAFTDALSNATVGTAFAGLVGKEMSDHNMITLGYPIDVKEKKLWETEGKRPYSVKLGNKWFSMNYIQPFGSILAYGAAYSQARKSGETIESSISTSAAEATKAVTGQSFLKGLSGAIQAVQDPAKSAETFVQQTAGSLVPNLIQSGVNATDSQQRVVKNPVDALKNDIPGLRQSLPVKEDIFGKTVPRASGGISTFGNPLNPSDVRNSGDTTVQELQRLQDTKNGIIPTQYNKTTFDSNTYGNVKITDAQVRELQGNLGRAIKPVWDNIISDPRYTALTDEKKNTALKSALDTVSEAIKRQYATDNGIAINKDPTKKTSDFLQGQTPDFLATKPSKVKKVKNPKVKGAKARVSRARATRRSTTSAGSPFKYAIKLSKGNVSAPRVSVAKSRGVKSRRVAVSKPKVSIKKSYA